MNLLDGILSDGNVRIGEQFFAGPNGTDRVKLGVRPEHLILAEEGGLPMQVKVVEPTGAETMVYLSYEGQDVTAVFRERHTFESGQTIHLKPDRDHLHIFDAKTGARL
jgi:multiple sugar transport system ATP-binding protein